MRMFLPRENSPPLLKIYCGYFVCAACTRVVSFLLQHYSLFETTDTSDFGVTRIRKNLPAVRSPPQTRWEGDFTVLPRHPSWWKRARCLPSQEPYFPL